MLTYWRRHSRTQQSWSHRLWRMITRRRHRQPAPLQVRKTLMVEMYQTKCLISFYWTEWFFFQLMSQSTYAGVYPNTRSTFEFHSPESKICNLTEEAPPGTPQSLGIYWAVGWTTPSVLDWEQLTRKLACVFFSYTTFTSPNPILFFKNKSFTVKKIKKRLP